jgi:hypothetical protein
MKRRGKAAAAAVDAALKGNAKWEWRNDTDWLENAIHRVPFNAVYGPANPVFLTRLQQEQESLPGQLLRKTGLAGPYTALKGTLCIALLSVYIRGWMKRRGKAVCSKNKSHCLANFFVEHEGFALPCI